MKMVRNSQFVYQVLTSISEMFINSSMIYNTVSIDVGNRVFKLSSNCDCYVINEYDKGKKEFINCSQYKEFKEFLHEILNISFLVYDKKHCNIINERCVNE